MHSNVKRIKEKINFGGQTIRLETDKGVPDGMRVTRRIVLSLSANREAKESDFF